MFSVEITFPESDDDQEPTIEEPIYDVPYNYRQNREPSKFIEKLETAEFVSSKRGETFSGPMSLPRPPVRSSSLMSIDERGETPEACSHKFCQHGLINGCTALTQRPEEVTEEIFEGNWMKRLENLRAREAALKEKETVLFDRERLLFKKERELRILERLVKDKLKHVEMCSKRFRHQLETRSADDASDDSRGSKPRLEIRPNSVEGLDTRKSIQMKASHPMKSTLLAPLKSLSACDNPIKMSEPYSIIPSNINPMDDIVGSETQVNGIKGPFSTRSSGSVASDQTSGDGKMTNPPNSRSSLVSKTFLAPNCPISGSINRAKSASLGQSSMRRKRRPKVCYEDLDSTLSADIGDSSFVVTSRIFDPAVFKKPVAFTRSASERRSQIEEEKVLKRLSENIIVSQDRNTKFQDYGLIDLGRRGREEDEKRCSYLNLEKGVEKGKTGVVKEVKERPVSWCEEQNAWLQKKRMAYNCTMQRPPPELFDKENLQRKGEVKKKVSMVKKFSIFR